MGTQCTPEQLSFQALGRRQVVGRFDGGFLTSDGGALLLREADRQLDLTRRVAACFTDARESWRVEHGVGELVAQRVHGLALGYEDLNDHDRLRSDPLLALAAGKADPTGGDRPRARDRGRALAGSSTLNRLELGVPQGDEKRWRYSKIVADEAALDRLLVDLFLESRDAPAGPVWLDLDATDDPLHGDQQGRFFHGYYKSYCYLPLYIFSGGDLLCARLRPSNIDACAGSVAEVERIVARIRRRWPKAWLIVRGDSGFCREALMGWCEDNGVDYLFGLARNERLVKRIAKAMRKSRSRHVTTGKASRRFREFRYRTRTSWSRSRRVVAKAEWLAKGDNPRFVVTSLSKKVAGAQHLYEKLYCARGDMENWIKGAPGELACVQPVQVRREERVSRPLPPRVMGRHSRGWGLSVDRGAGRRGYGAPKTVMIGMPRLSLRSKATSVPPRWRWGGGVPRCLRTQACSYARRRDLGGLRVIPLSWRDR